MGRICQKYKMNINSIPFAVFISKLNVETSLDQVKGRLQPLWCQSLLNKPLGGCSFGK